MTLYETGSLLAFIKTTNPDFVIEEYISKQGFTISTVNGWWATLKDYHADDVLAAAIIHNRRSNWPPKPENLISIINERTQLEWEPEAIVAFLKQNAWDRTGDTVLQKCPPNCQTFLKKTWKQLIKMDEHALQEYIKVRARTFDMRSQPALPPFPRAIQKMVKGVG